MKIGIVVYSETGNTLNVANKLEKELTNRNYDVTLEQITKEGSNSDPTKVVLENCPKVDQYDVIVLGTPVHAFSVALEMKTYLEQLPTLEGKKVNCFVTQQLPKAWMGGNRSLRQLETLCRNKGAVLNKKGVINWSSKKRNEEIDSLVKLFADNIV